MLRRMTRKPKLDYERLWVSACEQLGINHKRPYWISELSARKKRRWWELARRRDWERPLLTKLVDDILDADPMADIHIFRDKSDMELFVKVSCDSSATAQGD